MTGNMEKSYWATNEEWYTIDYEKDTIELTDKAPEEAKESFELWKNSKTTIG